MLMANEELKMDNYSDIYEIDTKDWITKSNTIIESTYKLSLQEQRILLITASKVQPNDEDFKAYKFRVRDLINKISAGNQVNSMYTYLKEVIKGLQSKTIEYRRGNKTFVTNWLVTSIYEETEGTIMLKLNPDLKDFFLQLKERFTSYQLENVIQLNSVYSIRIYELLKQYEYMQKRSFTLEELRKKVGIEQNKYKQYGHFKDRVINVAKRELDEKTDIGFTFEEIKKGRKVTGIVFYIKSKTSEEENSSPVEREANPEFEKADLQYRLKQLKVSSDKINHLFEHYSLDQIKRNVEYCEQKEHTVTSIGGFTYKAISSDYASSEVQLFEAGHLAEEESAMLFHLAKYWRTSKGSHPNWFVDEKSVEEIQKHLNVDAKQAQAKYNQIKMELYKGLDLSVSKEQPKISDEELHGKKKELESRLKKYRKNS
jgi:plasmid replication initiation protein